VARTVFFSFHYQRDIFRVQQVKQHYVAKGNYTAAGYFDGSLEEKAKREGDQAVKGLIDRGLIGASVLCVLIGAETYSRRWVAYEILKAVELGMGVLGIRIHQLKDTRTGLADVAGTSPFELVGYGMKNGKRQPMIHYSDGWKDAPYLSPVNGDPAPYLVGKDKPVFSSLFDVHDWVNDDGYNRFDTWVEAVARQAGR